MMSPSTTTVTAAPFPDPRTGSVEPIAVVGMACRLPGAPDLTSFWKLLLDGKDGILENSLSHLSSLSTDDRKSPDQPGTSRNGGFLPEVDRFDAEFFGFSEHEMVRMSPAHRLLFEVTWDAIEDSGTPLEALAGTRTSVFTSCVLTPDYWNSLVERGMHDLYAVTGAALYGTAAGRVAHALDLRGPTMAVDAACSGSLLAVHLACASIRSGESEMALVTGVNLQMGTAFTSALTTGRVISPLGQCRFGDRDANGYVRSDGGLAVLLKPLRTAVADGDRIYATILGSGTSSVGRAARSIVAPSAPAQVAAITAAHAQAGISPTEVGYVEAHGTGTTKGDHAELTAFGSVFHAPPGTSEPCLVGSAKSNVGHTEAAAGLVGLIKAALAIRHGVIPPTLHVDTPNPVLATEARQVELVREIREWPARGVHRIAGVNACGMSGTNVHVVLAEPAVPREHARVVERRPETLVLPVSARSPQALMQLTEAFADRVENTATDEELRDVVHTAGARRTHYEYRVAVSGSTREQLVAGLRAAVADRPVDTPRVVFVCGGLDVPWLDAGLPELPAFRRRVEECDKALQEHLGWSVLDRLTTHDPLTGDVRDTLPVLWAVQVGLAAVWEDYGVEPDTVIGHGVGKLAAATIRGSESIREAAALIAQCAGTMDGERLASFGPAVSAPRRTLYVELGPESRLATAVPSLRAGEPAAHTVLTGLAAAYTRGVDVDWAAVQPGQYVSVPSYPWQRRRYWIDDEDLASPLTADRTPAYR